MSELVLNFHKIGAQTGLKFDEYVFYLWSHIDLNAVLQPTREKAISRGLYIEKVYSSMVKALKIGTAIILKACFMILCFFFSFKFSRVRHFAVSS